MASRRGVLGDAYLKEACEEYKPLPIGYANANNPGGKGNPYLPGIKISKYQQAAVRPVSADVLAVAAARLSGAPNQAGVAREMLEKFIEDGARFKPVPVQIKDMTQNLEDMYAKIRDEDLLTQVDLMARGFTSKEELNDYLLQQQGGPLPKVRMASRGERILKQTIGQAAVAAAASASASPQGGAASASPQAQQGRDQFFYLYHYEKMSADAKRRIHDDLITALEEQGVTPDKYARANQGKGKATAVSRLDMPTLLNAAFQRNATINYDEMFGTPPDPPPQTPRPPARLTRRRQETGSLRRQEPTPQRAQAVPLSAPERVQAGPSGQSPGIMAQIGSGLQRAASRFFPSPGVAQQPGTSLAPEVEGMRQLL